jgi:hypothetical protein
MTLLFLVDVRRKKQDREQPPVASKKSKKAPAKSKVRKQQVKKKKPAPKSKERKKVQQELDEEQTKQKQEVFDDLSQRNKRGKTGDLTTMQSKMQDSLQEIIDLVVGRIHVDPARLRAPPAEYAARVLYQDHLQKLHRHFITGGMFVAQKDFILFLDEVMNLNLNSFDIFHR